MENNNSNQIRNTTLVLLIIGVITLLIFIIIMVSIYIKTHRQHRIKNHAEEELLTYTHDVKDNPIDIEGTKIPSSTVGNEYSLNFWMYINNLEYRGHHNKQILMKGDPGFYNKSLQTYTKSNPAIYISENSNTMKILFEKSSGAENIENKGCFRIFDIDTNNKYNISINHNEEIYYLNNNQGTAELIKDSEETNHHFKLERIEGTTDSYYIINNNKFLMCDGSKVSFNNPESTQEREDASVQEPSTDQELIYPEESDKNKYSFSIDEVLENNNVYFQIKPKNLNGENKNNYLSFLPETTLLEDPSIEDETLEDETPEDDVVDTIKLTLSNENNLFNIKPITNLVGLEEGKKTIDYCRIEAKESTDNSYFGMHLQNEEIKNGLIGNTRPSELDSSYCYINNENLNEEKLVDSYSIDDNLCKIHPESNETFGSNSHMYVHNVNSGSTFEIFEIKNIPLQRWVCVNITVRDHIVDVSLDGLLYRTFSLTNGSPKPNNFPIILGNNGGFDGYISRLTWSNKALTPGEIYNKYTSGPRITKGVWDRIKDMFVKNKQEEKTE